eukprot:GHVU01167575.1.p1 GENE.GHVU01167575.1~~GHVU01167575.1.p1  ORF type:complete len:101 (-),score=13.65 GHVU01167575.1:538-840(-)
MNDAWAKVGESTGRLPSSAIDRRESLRRQPHILQLLHRSNGNIKIERLPAYASSPSPTTGRYCTAATAAANGSGDIWVFAVIDVCMCMLRREELRPAKKA